MLNLNEDDVKAAIVQKVADEILQRDDDISTLVAKEVKARLDKIFIDKAHAQVEAAITEAVQGSFDREYQRVTAWGEPDGPKTTIRAELLKTVNGYWSARVNARNGEPSSGSYDSVTRAQYVMTQVCAKDFIEHMKQAATNVTGALKDGLRVQLAQHMDELLNDLFRVKSLQDQGKVEKPY
ncbi:hypothetical protein [Pseudoduganella chitinolytica]|uniref:DUF1631 family protein n=1 Tax=Pseudoduganella chitinolytica TaxID=34070 RepID=A0ABY8BJN8_9BURK|nr:hypothetical protein [Pseudoduganella chitinolytica]WEF34897.1 hypothetical protein PX653_09095 [Pseudoduganella chitinolytica]